MKSWNGAVKSSRRARARSTYPSPSTARRMSRPVSSSVMAGPPGGGGGDLGVAAEGGGDELAAGTEVLGGVELLDVDTGQRRRRPALLLDGVPGSPGDVEVGPHAGGVDVEVAEAVGQPRRGGADAHQQLPQGVPFGVPGPGGPLVLVA